MDQWNGGKNAKLHYKFEVILTIHAFPMQLSLLQYDNEGQLDQSSIIPLVDGGTEGFKGHARVILPGITACMDCTMDLYPPQVQCTDDIRLQWFI